MALLFPSGSGVGLPIAFAVSRRSSGFRLSCVQQRLPSRVPAAVAGQHMAGDEVLSQGVLSPALWLTAYELIKHAKTTQCI